MIKSDSSTADDRPKQTERGRSTSRRRSARIGGAKETSSTAKRVESKRQRSSSRSRSKSAGRPAGSKSKNRTTSEIMSAKKSNVTSRSRSASPSRSSLKKDAVKPLQEPVVVIQRRTRGTESTKVTSSGDEQHRLVTPVRHSTRLQELADHSECQLSAPQNTVTSIAAAVAPVSAAPLRSFGGPFGVSVLMILLPLLVLYLNKLCLRGNAALRWVSLPREWTQYFNLSALALTSVWLLFQAVLCYLPIGGPLVRGLPRSNGGPRLRYRCNGFLALLLSVGALFVAYYRFNLKLNFVLSHWTALMASSTLLSLFLSIALFIKSRYAKDERDISQDGGASSCWVYGFFMGRELNPHVLGGLNLKLWALRCALITWAVFDCIYCAESYAKKDGKSYLGLWTVAAFHLFYIMDALWHERHILSTMTVTQEGLGFMSIFSFFTFIPFTYTLTARYLYLNPSTVSVYYLLPIVALFFVGYFIYRGANNQKHEFRCNPAAPSLAHLETIATTLGRKLICGGWWGLVRHPNYLGDMILSIAFSLPCGFNVALPWFYPVFLTFTLLERASRDGELNQRKYGAAWTNYCQRVPYVLFPRIY